MTPLYTGVATSTGDARNGHVESESGHLSVDVRHPRELGGPGGATNPEELFAAGYAACFHSALKRVGAGSDLDGSAVTVSASLARFEDGGYGLAVDIDVHVPALDTDEARALADKAHDLCPYS